MAERIEKKLLTTTCTIGGEEKSLLEIFKRYGIGALDAAQKGTLAEHIAEQRTDRRPEHVLPDITSVSLLGRKDEVHIISSFLSGHQEKIMVVYGSRGIGKKTLVAHCLRKMGQKRVLWIDTCTGKKSDVEKQLAKFLKSHGLPSDTPENSIPPSTVLAIVDYHDPEEGLSDMLLSLTEKITARKGVKIVITTRGDTPLYHRFYSTKPHTYITLKGLSQNESGEYMGISGEELRTIHQFLRGNPLAMRYLLEENRQGILEITPLNPEEVRLLLYLKERGIRIAKQDDVTEGIGELRAKDE